MRTQAKSNKEFLAIDEEQRQLTSRNEEIAARVTELNKLKTKLNKEEEDYNKSLEEKALQEVAKELEANAGKIANLAADEATLATLRQAAQDAKALYEQYNPAAVADRPADWTEAKLDELDVAFLDADAAFNQFRKEVEKVRELKTVADAAKAAEDAKFAEDL